MPSMKWIIVNNLFLCFIMSCLLSICLTVGQGVHLSLEGFAFTFAVAFIASLVIAFAVPLPKMGAWFTRQMGSDPENRSGLYYLVESAIQVTFFLTLVNLVMTIALSGIGDINGLSWFDRWWIMNMQFWAVALVAFLIARPVSAALASKIAGAPGAKAAE